MTHDPAHLKCNNSTIGLSCSQNFSNIYTKLGKESNWRIPDVSLTTEFLKLNLPVALD